MLSRYNVMVIHNALTQHNPPPLFVPVADRSTWDAVRGRLGEEGVARWVEQAEQTAVAEIPPLPATLYLDFKRTGERLPYENPSLQRRIMLKSLAIAECLENGGRFLDSLLDVVWAICEQSAWAWPAHQRELADIHKPVIDLAAGMTATQLAEFDLLLGEKLDPRLRQRIHAEIDRRLLTPYLSYDWQWWMHNTSDREVNNWNAVVNGCIIRSALLVEQDDRRLAEIIARATRSLDDYLATFDADGGSTEGPSYWSYGFGHFIMAADALYQRTEGTIDFFAEEIVQKAIMFPARTILSHNWFVTYSDCDVHTVLEGALLRYLSGRYAQPELMSLANQQGVASGRVFNSLAWTLRDLFWQGDATVTAPFIPNTHDWYPDMQWLFSRQNPADSDALVMAIKGGHNDEMHNQNDVGSLIVHVNGESIIADLGRGRYTKAYFSDKRYDHFVCQSLSHSTLIPNGQQQRAGRNYAAQVVAYQQGGTADSVTFDLKAAYPAEAKLASLLRQVTFHRDTQAGWIELHDEATFIEAGGQLDSVLMTFGAAELQDGVVILHGEKGALRVMYDPQMVRAQVETIPDVDLAEGLVTVQRVIFSMHATQTSGQISLEIYPQDNTI